MTAGLASPSASASASYAAEVARLLWPEPWEVPAVVRGPLPTSQGHRDAWVFPSVANPRLLVPTDVPGSSVMVRRLGGSRSGLVNGLAGPARVVLEHAVRTRALVLAGWPRLRMTAAEPGADSIERHLSEGMGREVRVGVMLGTRRANQKPVLQVFGTDGTVLGFAKIGHNPLTANLVRREAAALAVVAEGRPHSFRSPRVLHHETWRGLEVLVMSALKSGRGHDVSSDQRLAAVREIIGLGGRTTSELSVSAWFIRLSDRAAATASSAIGARLHAAVEALGNEYGSRDLELGGWHGDWGHWNMGIGPDGLQVWDWERYEPDVPLAFDELHYAAQGVRPEGGAADAQEHGLLSSVGTRLAALGVPRDRHHLTLLLYLADIGTRYVEAFEHGATPVLRRRTEWVVDLLERRLDHPRPTPNGAP